MQVGPQLSHTDTILCLQQGENINELLKFTIPSTHNNFVCIRAYKSADLLICVGGERVCVSASVVSYEINSVLERKEVILKREPFVADCPQSYK